MRANSRPLPNRAVTPSTIEIHSDAELVKALDALSNPVRLAIVRVLGSPQCLSKIRISSPADSGRRPNRGEVLARQTIKEHINRLADAGIIVAGKVSRGDGEATEYAVNHQALFGILEAFQDLARSLAAPASARR